MILYHISAKKLITRCTFSMLAASLILCPAVFSGCSAKTENVKNTDAGSQDPISATAIKLNTAVTVTIYDSQDRVTSMRKYSAAPQMTVNYIS